MQHEDESYGVDEHLSAPNMLLTDVNCSGYPYLTLAPYDYNLKKTNLVYENLSELVLQYGTAGIWGKSKSHLFDIHPVFSNAEPIPGLLGFHLSLLLLHKGVADSSQTLYFDIASNWRKFTRVPDRRSIFPLASWMRFRNDQLFSDDDGDAVDIDPETEENGLDEPTESAPFIFAKSCINLVRGAELNTIKKTAPTEFTAPLLKYYSNMKPAISDIRTILKSEIAAYQRDINFEIERTPNLKDSALYLFLVFLCREYRIDPENFNGVVNELGLKFDFAEKSDVINHLLLCSGYINRLKVNTGEYYAEVLNYAQCDATTLLIDPEIELEKQLDSVDQATQESQITQLKESKLSYSVKGLSAFYKMDPAITDEKQCAKIILKIWRDLLQCFYIGTLNQQISDSLRSKANTLLLKYLTKHKHELLSFSNLQLQQKAFESVAYNIFIQCHEKDENESHGDEAIGEELFKKLLPPSLTQDQVTAKNLLNTRAKLEYETSILEGHRNELIKFLNSTVGKIAHPNLSDQHGARLAMLDHGTLKQMIVQWYVDNYVKAYLELNNDYNFIFEKMTFDLKRFTADQVVESAILAEVRNFVRSKFNPHLILDFTINF